MDVVAYLPPQLLGHLKVVVGREHQLTAVTSWRDLVATARTRIVDMIVVDPVSAGSATVPDVEQFTREFPSVPIVVYTMFTPTAVKAIVRLAQRGVRHVVLNRFDDEPRRFLSLLEQVPADTLGDLMVAALAQSLAQMPGIVARAIEQMYRSPLRFRTTEDLAAAAGMTPRTLYRAFDASDLRSPRELVASARLLRAFAYLRDPGRPVKAVAKKMGYQSAWQLQKQMRLLIGVTPSEARQALDATAFIARLSESLRKRD